MYKNVLSLVFATVLAAACGNGGGKGQAPADLRPETGEAVAGLDSASRFDTCDQRSPQDSTADAVDARGGGDDALAPPNDLDTTSDEGPDWSDIAVETSHMPDIKADEIAIDLCVGVECDDGDICTDDLCDPLTGECSFPANGAPCDDGEACTVGDTCTGGECIPGEVDKICLGACGDGKCVFTETSEECPVDCGWCGDEVCGIAENGPDGGSCPQDCLAACGDDKCQGGESAQFCPMDCGGCGDGLCNLGESPETCAGDCPVPCGDGECGFGEDALNCPTDCMPPCGDGVCEGGENPYACPADCGMCGDGICSAQEDVESCEIDCASPCGNGICEGGETPVDCAVDCGSCGDDVCGYAESDETCPADCFIGCGDLLCLPGETEESCPIDCALDDDKDGIVDADDNCPWHPNADQLDFDEDGQGDECDGDDDGDGEQDSSDCAPFDPENTHLLDEVCDGKDNDCDLEIDNGEPCADGDQCTLDVCGGEAGCTNTLVVQPCDDGWDCTADDECDVTGVCAGTLSDDWHFCQGECADSTSHLTCGDQCEPCLDPEYGNPVCVEGECGLDCDEGYSDCQTYCADLVLYETDCGECGHACQPGGKCFFGSCTQASLAIGIVTGANQSGYPAQELAPVTIRVIVSASEEPAEDVEITFTAPAGGAVEAPSAVTNLAGGGGFAPGGHSGGIRLRRRPGNRGRLQAPPAVLAVS